MELEWAKHITPDIKDIDYLALAKAIKCPVWSSDKPLKNQTAIIVYSTKDLIEQFGL